MILHLLSDDKFADYAIKQFLATDTKSEFILVVPIKEYKVQRIVAIEKIKILKYQSEEYNKLLKSLHNFKAIVSHGLFEKWQEEIIKSSNTKTKIAWVFWGGEIYGRPEYIKKFFSKRSKALLYLRLLVNKLNNKASEYQSFYAEVETFKRIDYCLTDVHEDFKYVKEHINPIIKELWYNYYSIEETIGDLKDKVINGKNILIGNSSTLENNHLDAFSKLKQFDLSNRNVIVPLSYGQIWLRRFLLKQGNRVFKDSFYPLVDFLSLEEYNKKILSCSIVIMPHYRPQAMGNLLTAFWLGSKVYMSKKSMLYDYFKRLSVHVFSIEDDLVKSNMDALEPLSPDLHKHNQNILIQEYGKENMKIRINKLVEELSK